MLAGRIRVLITKIKWRKWPEEKPPRKQSYTVRFQAGEVAMRYWDGGAWTDDDGTRYTKIGITHFALPSDITTEESNGD